VRPRRSFIREAIRTVLAANVKTPTRAVARRIVGMPGIVSVRDAGVQYRVEDDEASEVTDVKFDAFANLVSQERQALRLGR
jgi:hypothetical protein